MATITPEQQQQYAKVARAAYSDPGFSAQSKQAAQDASDIFIMTKLRENSFAERIIPPTTVTKKDFVYHLGEDLFVYNEMETNTYGCATVDFAGGTVQAPYRGLKFTTLIATATTPEYIKNQDELVTYKKDPREITCHHAVNELDNISDSTLIHACDVYGGATPNAANTAVTNLDFPLYTAQTDAMSRETFVDFTKFIKGRRLPQGIVLMNELLASDFAKWNRNEVGGDLAEKMLREGSKPLVDGTVLGTSVLRTIKYDIVPDNVVYAFTTPDHLGVFYEYMPPTLSVSKEKDMLKFSARRKFGMSIANLGGIHKHAFSYAF